MFISLVLFFCLIFFGGLCEQEIKEPYFWSSELGPLHTFMHRAGVPRLGCGCNYGILPHLLWPHDVAVCIRSCRPGGCTTTRGPLNTAKREDFDPRNDVGSSLETSYAPADDRAPCYGQSNQIHGRTDRNTMKE